MEAWSCAPCSPPAPVRARLRVGEGATLQRPETQTPGGMQAISDGPISIRYYNYNRNYYIARSNVYVIIFIFI